MTAATVMMVTMGTARLLHLLHLLLQRRKVLLRLLHVAGLQSLADLIERLRKRIVRIPVALAAESRISGLRRRHITGLDCAHELFEALAHRILILRLRSGD